MSVRTFALVVGAVFVVIGLLGFVPGLVRPAGPDAPPLALGAGYGLLLGLFAVNVLHNVVHVALGAWGLLAARALPSARAYARGLTWIYGVLAVMGLVPGLWTMFGLTPLFGHDVWLHALTALLAAWFGYRQAPVGVIEREDRARERSRL